MKRFAWLLCCCMAFILSGTETPAEFRLWQGDAPGAKGTAVADIPVMTMYLLENMKGPVAGNINMTVKSYTDMLGRNFKTEYADGSYSMNYYNARNQLIKSVTPGGVVTLYTYDNLGRQISQAIDMNRNGEIDAADLEHIPK